MRTPESDDIRMTLRNLFENGNLISNLPPAASASALPLAHDGLTICSLPCMSCLLMTLQA